MICKGEPTTSTIVEWGIIIVYRLECTAPPDRGSLSRALFRAPGGDSRGLGAETHKMPTDLQDAKTGGIELLFPKDDIVPGLRFELKEAAVYDAEEVREEVGGDYPEFGRWVPVTYDGEEAWIAAVGELVTELQRYENPLAMEFEVTRCEKSGQRDTAPYEVNLEEVNGDAQQTGL